MRFPWQRIGLWLAAVVAAGMLAHPWLDVAERARVRTSSARVLSREGAARLNLLAVLREHRLAALAAGGASRLPSIAEIETLLDPALCGKGDEAGNTPVRPAVPLRAPGTSADECDACLTVSGPHLSLPGSEWTLSLPPRMAGVRLPAGEETAWHGRRRHAYFQVRGPPAGAA